MTSHDNDIPAGARAVPGVVHRPSPFPVEETVARLQALVAAAGAKVFALVDHSGEAAKLDLPLRDTKVLVFGNPAAGTPLMREAPLIALDLPLKVLVWADDDGKTWMSYAGSDWLAERHGISANHAQPLGAVDVLTGRLV